MKPEAQASSVQKTVVQQVMSDSQIDSTGLGYSVLHVFRMFPELFSETSDDDADHNACDIGALVCLAVLGYKPRHGAPPETPQDAPESISTPQDDT